MTTTRLCLAGAWWVQVLEEHVRLHPQTRKLEDHRQPFKTVGGGHEASPAPPALPHGCLLLLLLMSLVPTCLPVCCCRCVQVKRLLVAESEAGNARQRARVEDYRASLGPMPQDRPLAERKAVSHHQSQLDSRVPRSATG